MSTRATTVGAEFSATVENNARVTTVGAEFSAAVINNGRITAVGVEYSYRELIAAHGISGYLKDALVNHIFRSATLVKPTQLWTALYSLPPNASGGGTEVSGNAYARAQLNPGEANWTPQTGSNGTTSNGAEITYPTPSGGGWSTLTAWGLRDAPMGGNLLAFSTFSAGISVPAGSNPRFPVGELTITLDPAMAALGDYLKGQLINHIFRTATFAKPTALYFAAFTVAPTSAGGGTEITGGSYARVNLAPSDADWAAPSSGNGRTSNLMAITFPTPSADWGTMVAIGVFDAASAGNLLAFGTLTTPKTVHNGDAAPSIGIGEAVFQLA